MESQTSRYLRSVERDKIWTTSKTIIWENGIRRMWFFNIYIVTFFYFIWCFFYWNRNCTSCLEAFKICLFHKNKNFRSPLAFGNIKLLIEKTGLTFIWEKNNKIVEISQKTWFCAIAWSSLIFSLNDGRDRLKSSIFLPSGDSYQ